MKTIDLIPESESRAAFLSRPDISELPAEEQARRWAEHWPKARAFMDRLDAIGLGLPALASFRQALRRACEDAASPAIRRGPPR